MSAHRTAPRIAGAVLLAMAIGLPSIALAASGNSVSITAPSTGAVGRTFHFTVSGNSTASHRVLGTFVNAGLACPNTVSAELRTAYANTKVLKPVGKGRYSFRFALTPAHTGKHYICSYLYDTSYTTLAHASHKFINHR